MQKHAHVYLLFLICFCFVSLNSQAKKDNRILNFHTDIRMDTSGRAHITETIKVLYTNQRAQKDIVRRIYQYRFSNQNPEEVHVDSVLRNGEAKKYSTKRDHNDYLIEIENGKKKLTPGVYEYTFKYWSDSFFNDDREYGKLEWNWSDSFFNDDREYGKLEWNVNGSNWDLEIDSISATVHLPRGSKSIYNKCDIDITEECSYKNIGDTIIEFYADQKIQPHKNFTITASFIPKVIEETVVEDPVVDTDLLVKMTLGIVAIMLCLFFIFWRLINTMHEKAIVRPTSYPPLGKSPASMRAIFKGDTDTKGLAACLLSMAVKKAILIKRVGNKTFSFTSLGNKDQLSKDELNVYNQLYKRVGEDVSMGMKINSQIPQSSFYAMQTAVATDYKKYVLSKSPYIIRFVLLSLCCMVLWFVGMEHYSGVFLPILLHPIILAAIYYFSYLLAGQLWRANVNIILISFFTLVGIPFISWHFNPPFWFAIGTASALIFINNLFMRLINPTKKSGSQYRADLEGFRMSMTIKTSNALELNTDRDLTPEYFEEMLPYAVALDMETKWIEKFAQTGISYQSSWYLGPTGNSYLDYVEIAKSLRSAINCNVSKSPWAVSK